MTSTDTLTDSSDDRGDAVEQFSDQSIPRQLEQFDERTLPLIAIVGRPNVGKLTFFNRLAGERRAIVGDEPGIVERRGQAFDSAILNPRLLRCLLKGSQTRF